MTDEILTSTRSTHLRELIDRLARVLASDGWSDGLNPVQHTTLSYLAQANRFSRAPSQVADYLLVTRGTASQTLRNLAAKGLVVERQSKADKRSISYELTDAGRTRAAQEGDLDLALTGLSEDRRAALTDGLSDLLRQTLDARQGRSFGMCRTCRHHCPQPAPGAMAHCALLDVPLSPEDAGLICHEHDWRHSA